METKNSKEIVHELTTNERFQNMLKCFSKCKVDYANEREESKKIRDINVKLETELKEARELEKSHRYHLLTSREMISNLQETVSQLVYLKRDVKKLKDEISTKDTALEAMQKEKEGLLQKHNETVEELRNAHKQDIEELTTECEKKVQQTKYDADTQIGQFTYVIEELRNKLKEMEAEHREKMNMVVLEYEEKVQRSVAQVAQLQEQLARQTSHTDANIDAYRRKLEELEEKLKQNQFKEYLAQSNYPSQYENRVERPYSVDRDPYADSGPVDYNSINQNQKILATPSIPHTKTQKGTNTLQVMYQGSKNANTPKNDKKGHFNITKKRKLYNEKDFLNM
ncbi:uncharacterized protein [Epargyreus clarus]|uniref:uncharacterized protein n=1 Tax=Epargyreus clarus TaxID=520877 RepID=UPI003C2E185E